MFFRKSVFKKNRKVHLLRSAAEVTTFLIRALMGGYHFLLPGCLVDHASYPSAYVTHP